MLSCSVLRPRKDLDAPYIFFRVTVRAPWSFENSENNKTFDVIPAQKIELNCPEYHKKEEAMNNVK
jgi:hypothetical protein